MKNQPLDEGWKMAKPVCLARLSEVFVRKTAYTFIY